MEAKSWLLPTEEERSGYAADWPGNLRRVRSVPPARSGKTSDILLESAARELMAAGKATGRGMLVQARPGDGVSWAAQAVLDVVGESVTNDQIAVFDGDVGAGVAPRTLQLVGERGSLDHARAADVLAKRRPLRAVVLAAPTVLMLAAGALAIFVAARLVAGDPLRGGPILVALGLVALAPAVTFAARRVERRLDTKTNQFEVLVEQLEKVVQAATDGSPGEQRKLDAFVWRISGHLLTEGTCSVYLVDDVSRMGAFDRRVVNRLLHTSTAESGTIRRWFVFETAGEVLAAKTRAPAFTHVTTLRTYRLLPLEPDKIHALAARRGIQDYDPTQTLKSLGAPNPLRQLWIDTFDQLADVLTEHAAVGELHLLWVLAVGGTLEVPSPLARKELVSLLSSETRTRDVLLRQALSTTRLGNLFVKNTIAELTTGDWQRAFIEPAHAQGRDVIALRPDAARTIARRAIERGFGNRAFAAAFWALYFDDHAASGHQRRTRQVAAHLEDAFFHHPDPSSIDAAVGGRLTEVTGRVARQCLDFAQLGHLASLVAALRELTGGGDTGTTIASQAYFLTQDPDLISGLDNPAAPTAGGVAGDEVLRARIDRIAGLDGADRVAVGTLLANGPAEVRASVHIEEHVFSTIVALLSKIVPEHDQGREAHINEQAQLALGVLGERVGLLETGAVRGAAASVGRTAPDRIDLAVATLAASTSVWGLSWTVALAECLHAPQASIERRVAEVIGDLETAVLLVQDLNTTIERSPFSGAGSWPLVLDASCQQLSLTIVAACAVLTAATSDPALADRIDGVRREACEALQLEAQPTTASIKRRAELCAYLWSSLELDRVAAGFAQQFALLHAWLEPVTTDVGDIVELTAYDDTDRMIAELCRGVASRSNDHLAATYLARAALLFVNSDADADARNTFGRNSMIHAYWFGSIDLRPILQRLSDEFGVDGVLAATPAPQLSSFALCVFAVLKGVEDQELVAAFDAAFSRQVAKLPPGADRDSLTNELQVIRLPTTLKAQGAAAWPDLVAAFSGQAPSEWAWVLYLVALHIDPDEITDEIEEAFAKALSGMRQRAEYSAGSVSPNELALARALCTSRAEELSSSAMDVLHRCQAFIVEAMPIDFARHVVELLANDRQVDIGTHAVLDAHYLEQQAAAVFPSLYQSGNVFPVFHSYVTVLDHYGLKFAESGDELKAWLNLDCNAVIEKARALGTVPDPISRGRLRAGYWRIGTCLEAMAQSLPDDLQEVRQRVNDLARRNLPVLLRSGINLEGMPDNVQRILEDHFRREA